MMSDERMAEMGPSAPFDGKRMIMGGFESILDEGSGIGGYTDGFVLAVPEQNKDAYQAMAQKAAAVFQEHGATRVVEAWGDDVNAGKVTDFYRPCRRRTARRSSSPGSSGRPGGARRGLAEGDGRRADEAGP
jgi:uncharacterized protein YbaA (DUF1428 family)